MSVQIEARKNQMIMDLTCLRIECSMWERSKISLNKEYQRKLLEVYHSTNEKISRRTTGEPVKPDESSKSTARIIEEFGVRYYVNGDNDVFNMKKIYVGFWIPSEASFFFEDDEDDDDEDDDEDENEETAIKTPEQPCPKQPANPLGLSLEFPIIVQEDDEETLLMKYEQELDREMLLMKEKAIELDKLYSSRIGNLDKRISSLYLRIAKLETMLVNFGSKISNIKMKKIKDLNEMINDVWMNR